jgi:AraC-like DNA-binding protein
MNSHYLHEIVLFLTEQFDMVMTSIGYSSRDSIIDDVIYYIEHNYQSNITLENIAPLFGYNSSYLGKIFSKKLGITVGTFMMIYNVLLYIVCGIFIQSWILPLYSILTSLAALKSIDFIIYGLDRAKAAIIITT